MAAFDSDLVALSTKKTPFAEKKSFWGVLAAF
jgi:hypothetical protein